MSDTVSLGRINELVEKYVAYRAASGDGSPSTYELEVVRGCAQWPPTPPTDDPQWLREWLRETSNYVRLVAHELRREAEELAEEFLEELLADGPAEAAVVKAKAASEAGIAPYTLSKARASLSVAFTQSDDEKWCIWPGPLPASGTPKRRKRRSAPL